MQNQIKFKAISLQALRVPADRDSQISRQSAHEVGKVVSPTYRPPLPPRNIPGTHFCKKLSQPQGHSAAGRIMSMKDSNDTIGNRTRDLPAVVQCLNQLRHYENMSYYTENEMSQCTFFSEVTI